MASASIVTVNVWCGWGSNGVLQSEPTDMNGREVYQLSGKSEELDGVKVFDSQGKPLAFIRLLERCANLTFGGPKKNRLYMAACHSIYAHARQVDISRAGRDLQRFR